MNTLDVWQKYPVIENEVDALIDDYANMYFPLLAKDHWRGSSTRNVHMVHIVSKICFKMVYTS